MTEDEAPHAASHSYFIPMVDMLAGVVFILVILLASVTLVSREDFSATQDAQTEISRIQQELEAARAIERTVLQPRRTAQAALELLLTKLRDDLIRSGFSASTDPAQGRLEIEAGSVFVDERGTLSPVGERLAGALATTLAAELPCLAKGTAPKAPGCADYRSALLDRAVVAVSDRNSQVLVSDVRALSLLSAMSKVDGTILGMKAADGDQLLTYRGFAPAASVGPGVRLVLSFQMNSPPLPPEGG